MKRLCASVLRVRVPQSRSDDDCRNDAYTGGFGGCRKAEGDAAHYREDQQKKWPEAENVEENGSEMLAVVLKGGERWVRHASKEDVGHEECCQQDPRQDTGQEELADRGLGQCAEDQKGQAWGDQEA